MNIETDASMNRHYIPVCDKWEIQTKGNGSSFRIAKTDGSMKRYIVLDEGLHAALEEMARDINGHVHELKAQQYPAYIVSVDPTSPAKDAPVFRNVHGLTFIEIQAPASGIHPICERILGKSFDQLLMDCLEPELLPTNNQQGPKPKGKKGKRRHW